MRTQKRYSRRRELILSNLRGRCDHPSADTVYLSVREQLPNISLGTVYRNLNELSSTGEILRFTFEGKEHFDGNVTPHYHFCCAECGMIYDVFDDSVSRFRAEVVERLKCEADDIQIVVNGRCNACLNKK